jgi:hypothetical protein
MERRRLRARVNWAARWGGVAFVALIAGLYVYSAVRYSGVEGGGRGGYIWVSLIRGQLVVVRAAPGPQLRTRWMTAPIGAIGGFAPSWREALQYKSEAIPSIGGLKSGVPLWPFAVALAVPTTLAWRHRTRQKLGSCPSCGYDLSGLPRGSPCPECAADRES